MYRFAFIMDQQVGLRTQALNFEQTVSHDPEIDPVWVPVHYQADAGPLSRLQGIPEQYRGTLRGVTEIRRGLSDQPDLDGAVWATWAAKAVTDLVSSCPSYLIMDMTPTQMEDMGDQYGYTRSRARFLGGWKRRSTFALYQQATHMFPWNKWVADSLVGEYDVPASKITPVSPGVDLNLYRPAPEARAADGTVRLLFVGGDFRRKGGDLLLRWARETRVQTPWELHIATRDDVPATPGVFVHRNLTNNSPELVRLYQSCDAFVLPTRADCYSFVSMEAMATGMPVVISRLGGIPELITEGENGFLLDVDDYRTLSRHLDALVTDSKLRSQMGAMGRRRAEALYDGEKNLKHILRHMKDQAKVGSTGAIGTLPSAVVDPAPSHSRAVIKGSTAASLADVVARLDAAGSNRRRVALVLNSYVYGGVEEHAFLLSTQLPHYGYQPIVICNECPGLEPLIQRLDAAGVPRIVHDVTRSGFWTQTRAARELVATLKALKADLLHIQLISYYGGRVPLLAGRWANIPMILTHHIAPEAPLSQMEQWGRRPFLDDVSRFIAVSHENRRLQIANMGLPEAQTICVHNGIVPSPFPPDHVAARQSLLHALELPRDARIVGACGRLVHQKGFDQLVAAAPNILKQVPSAHFVMIGEGELLEPLQQQCRELGVDGRFHWLGFRKDAQAMLSGMDVLCMPSLFEGLPLVLLESMAAEIPVVATAVSGIPEALTDQEEGLLFQAGDVEALAAGVISVLADPDRARALGMQARRRILSSFTLDTMTQKTASVYDDVLSISSSITAR